jgi:hypothetical protein
MTDVLSIVPISVLLVFVVPLCCVSPADLFVDEEIDFEGWCSVTRSIDMLLGAVAF